MTDANTICRRCGFSNIPGDQFCGSCGAFLEWEGQPTGPSADAGTPVAPAPESPVAPVQTTWSPVPSAGIAPAAPAAATSDSSLDLIRCPACGIANAAGRTFCQSCGATLAAASRVEELPHDVVAAAVAAVPTAPPASPASIRQAEAGRFGATDPRLDPRGRRPRARRRGRARDRQHRPQGQQPRLRRLGGARCVGRCVVGRAGSGRRATRAPWPAASVKLSPTGATASSVILDLAKFQPGKAIDGDRDDELAGGRPREKDQWIEVAFAPSRADAVVIRNGYQASNALYRSNRRLKDVLVSVGGGTPIGRASRTRRRRRRSTSAASRARRRCGSRSCPRTRARRPRSRARRSTTPPSARSPSWSSGG